MWGLSMPEYLPLISHTAFQTGSQILRSCNEMMASRRCRGCASVKGCAAPTSSGVCCMFLVFIPTVHLGTIRFTPSVAAPPPSPPPPMGASNRQWWGWADNEVTHWQRKFVPTVTPAFRAPTGTMPFRHYLSDPSPSATAISPHQPMEPLPKPCSRSQGSSPLSGSPNAAPAIQCRVCSRQQLAAYQGSNRCLPAPGVRAMRPLRQPPQTGEAAGRKSPPRLKTLSSGWGAPFSPARPKLPAQPLAESACSPDRRMVGGTSAYKYVCSGQHLVVPSSGAV